MSASTHRPRREHHLVHDVHRQARQRHEDHPARHRHGQHAEPASGRGRRRTSRCSTTCSTAASSSASAPAACCRTPKCSAISTTTATRCSSRRSTTCSAIWAGEPPYNIKGKYWNIKIERQFMPEIGQGFLPKPLQRPHPPIVVTAVAPFSKGVTEAAARGWDPISANFLMPEWVKSHWPKYVEGCERVGRKADPANWRVAKSIFVADDDKTAKAYATDPNSPYRFYYSQLFTKLKKRPARAVQDAARSARRAKSRSTASATSSSSTARPTRSRTSCSRSARRSAISARCSTPARTGAIRRWAGARWCCWPRR